MLNLNNVVTKSPFLKKLRYPVIISCGKELSPSTKAWSFGSEIALIFTVYDFT